MEDPKTAEAAFRAEARRFAHQLRNHLFTISMGLKSLDLTRNDPERFASLVDQIRAHGIAGIEDVANALDDFDAYFDDDVSDR